MVYSSATSLILLLPASTTDDQLITTLKDAALSYVWGFPWNWYATKIGLCKSFVKNTVDELATVHECMRVMTSSYI